MEKQLLAATMGNSMYASLRRFLDGPARVKTQATTTIEFNQRPYY